MTVSIVCPYGRCPIGAILRKCSWVCDLSIFEKCDACWFPIGFGDWEGEQSTDTTCGVKIEGFSSQTRPCGSSCYDFCVWDAFASATFFTLLLEYIWDALGMPCVSFGEYFWSDDLGCIAYGEIYIICVFGIRLGCVAFGYYMWIQLSTKVKVCVVFDLHPFKLRGFSF